jgi:hypothetical protein
VELREQHDIRCRAAQRIDGVVSIRSDGGVMRFVHDHEVPPARLNGRPHFRALDVVDRRDDERLDRPRIHTDWQQRAVTRNCRRRRRA